jgi:hypothetical protein
VISVSSTWFKSEKDIKIEEVSDLNYTVYYDPDLFIENANYWLTFITGNIINRQQKINEDNIQLFGKSNLVQLSWVLPVAFKENKNVIVRSTVIACKAENTGNYNLFKVFGANMNSILNHLINQKLITKRVKKIINYHLLASFFPMILGQANNIFERNGALKIMIPLYWKNIDFWRNVFPSLVRHTHKTNSDG